MRKGLIFVFFVSLLSCSLYPMRGQKSLRFLKKREPLKAARIIEKFAKKKGDDQLVYLLDYATFLQSAEKYEESLQAFLKAELLSEVKDYHSLSRITGSIFLNEGMVQYKGEDYEKLLINVMLAINFLSKGDKEAALVETRKINEKLYRYKHEAKKNYEQNVFAYYLAALIWESDKKWEDAYLDYKKAYELDPHIPYLKEDLIRLSFLAQHLDEYKKWEKKFKMEFKKEWHGKDSGEIIFIFQQGFGPRKYPHPKFPRIPKLFPVKSYIKKSLVQVQKTLNPPSREVVKEKVGHQILYLEETQVLYSVQDVAIKTLDDKYKALIAKRLAGIVAKEVVSHQVEKHNEGLGGLLRLGLHIVDRADLRQWSSLPQTFQVSRIRLKSGKYKIKIFGLNSDGKRMRNPFLVKEVKVLPRKKVFFQGRSF